jgi:iron-sulfur cluster repair protein YtfE (RIC family)
MLFKCRSKRFTPGPSGVQQGALCANSWRSSDSLKSPDRGLASIGEPISPRAPQQRLAQQFGTSFARRKRRSNVAARIATVPRGNLIEREASMDVNTMADEVFEKVRREHESLKEQLGHIHHVLGSHNMPGDEVATQLRHFHAALVDHFWNEEHDGFFEEITNQAPNLTPQAHKVCAEHRAILHTVTNLTQFAVSGAGSEAWWRELGSRFQVFSKQLMHHESVENSLLLQAYQEDIGAHD